MSWTATPPSSCIFSGDIHGGVLSDMIALYTGTHIHVLITYIATLRYTYIIKIKYVYCAGNMAT